MLNILIPTYGRSQRLVPLLNNIIDTTSTEFKVSFIVEPEDLETCTVLQPLQSYKNVEVLVNTGKKDIVGANNSGFWKTQGEWIFTACDDIKFMKGWYQLLEPYTKDFSCIGVHSNTNPLADFGVHSPHNLVRRSWIMKYGNLFNPIYHHQYSDLELTGIAIRDEVFKFVPEMKLICFEVFDKTKHRAFEFHEEDMNTYNDRRVIWEGTVAYQDYLKKQNFVQGWSDIR